jgi:CMP-N,N'-diacetyllegionaminic acid synthase
MKILCTICARGGSKGVKNKNLKNLLGKPLIYHTISQAKKIKKFTKIVCSSDSKNILKIAKKNKVDYTLLRPQFLSNDKVEKLKAIKHCLINAEKFFNLKFDYIVDLDVTAPLRSNNDINKIINLISKNKKAHNVLSLTPSRKNPYFNMVEIKNNNKLEIVKKISKKIHSRQKAPKVYEINAGMYAWKRNSLIKNFELINKNTHYFIVPNARSVDIDTPEDFKIVKSLLK